MLDSMNLIPPTLRILKYSKFIEGKKGGRNVCHERRTLNESCQSSNADICALLHKLFCELHDSQKEFSITESVFERNVLLT